MNLFKFNLIVIGIPLFFFLIGIWNHGFWVWALLSSILTGLTHLVIGFGMWYDNPNDRHIKWYCRMVIAFFTSWFLSGLLGHSSNFTNYIIIIPPILAFYLTYIIYKEQR